MHWGLIFVSALGIWLFVRGFLLSRRSCDRHSPINSDITSSGKSNDSGRIYNHTLILLVDALRFDFAIPLPSKYHYHNKFPVISLSGSNSPDSWLLMHSVADAPTTTLQRLQALLTGGLPVFVDAGNNFQSTGNHLVEDNLIHQILATKNRSLLFVGDDTWMGLFSEEHQFHQHAIPYPSLNVFDLDTVDYGCLLHLYAYYGGESTIPADVRQFLRHLNLTEESKQSLRISSGQLGDKITIAHMLGVDHCGHRYGAEHPLMAGKLQFLHTHLQKILKLLPRDTLVILLSDHGMDNNGDHGGDSDLERDSLLAFHRTGSDLLDKRFFTAGGTWRKLSDRMERKGIGQSNRNGFTIPSFGLSDQDYDDGQIQQPKDYPIVDQIDFVPTIALLNGLAIPFSSLGMVVPQLFLRSDMTNESSSWDQIELDGLRSLLMALHINAKQIFEYLKVIHKDLAADTDILFRIFNDASEKHQQVTLTADFRREDIMDAIVEYMSFIRSTADIARKVWAQFDLVSIGAGCVLLMIAFVGRLKKTISSTRRLQLSSAFSKWPVVFTLLASALHWAVFATNSFIIWEDSVTNYLLQSTIIMAFLASRDRNSRLLLVSASIITRLASASRLCREEQGPGCVNTFSSAPQFLYSLLSLRDNQDSSFLVTESSAIWLWIQAFLMLPIGNIWIRDYRLSKQVPVACCLVAVYWSMEYAEERRIMIFWHWWKIVIAQLALNFGWLITGFRVMSAWKKNSDEILKILIDGVYCTALPLALPAGAWSLTLHYLLLHLLFAASQKISSPAISMLTSFAALISGWSAFFWTGHQATFSSIPFQIGLIGLTEAQFYSSGARLVWNITAPFVLSLLFYQRILVVSFGGSSKSNDKHLKIFMARAAQLYWCGLVAMSCIMTGHFRRHLMVWKVFTPRMMLSIVYFITVHVIDLFMQRVLTE